MHCSSTACFPPLCVLSVAPLTYCKHGVPVHVCIQVLISILNVCSKAWHRSFSASCMVTYFCIECSHHTTFCSLHCHMYSCTLKTCALWQIHQGAVSDGYPNYGQPPPPPPTSQHQRPSMQWQTGHQRHQQSNGIAHMAPQHHQQQMGMGHTGMGMYRNMLPYPVMPGMQSQVGTHDAAAERGFVLPSSPSPATDCNRHK